jgi:hypothetical protein
VKQQSIDKVDSILGYFALVGWVELTPGFVGFRCTQPNLHQLAEELMQPQNSWQVKLNEEGKPIWQSGEDVRTRQPAQSFWQRVMDVFFKLFPSKYF